MTWITRRMCASGLSIMLMDIFNSKGTHSQIRKRPAIENVLVYAFGDSIYRFVLIEAGVTKVEKLFERAGCDFGGLSKINEKYIVICDNIDRAIYKLNIETGNVDLMAKGLGPIYTPQHNMLFYYKHDAGEKGLKLVARSWEDRAGVELVIDGGPFYLPRQAVLVDGDHLVFQPSGGAGVQVNICNLRSLEVQKLPIFNCTPMFWRSRTQQLLCFDIRASDYLLSNLDGTVQERGIWPARSQPIVYLSKMDAALVSFENSDRYQGVALHRFSDGKHFRREAVFPRTPLGMGQILIIDI